MNIINDPSNQSVITSLPTITGVFNPFITSNDLYTNFYTKSQVDNISTLNNFYNKTSIDANIYTKSQVDNISTLNNFYNKTSIDANIYTKSQVDNNFYTQTQTNNLLNAKENVLTFSSPLTRTTNTIGINLNSYPTFVNLNSCNYITNAALTSYPTFVNLNSCNYITNAALTPYSTYTALNSCNYITNAALTPYSTYTALNSCNYITNATTGLTNYSTTTAMNSAISTALTPYLTTSTANTTYLKLDGSASMTSKLLLLTGGNGNPSFATNNGGAGDRIIFQSGIAGSVLPYSIGYSLNNLWISAPNTASINNYIDGTIKWSVGSTGGILYGILNATTLQEGGTNLDAKYLRLSGASAMSGALTVNGNININSSATNKLIFDNVLNNRKIELSTNHSIGVDNNGMIFSASAFRFAKATNINDIVFTVSAVGDLSFAGTIYSGAISTGGGILASSLTLGSTGDIITVRNITASGTVSANSFVEAGVSLSSKYLTSASLAGTYLKLDGTNDMTGKLTVLNAAGLNTPQIAEYGGTGDRIILWKGGGNYPYSLGMNGGTMWYSVPTGAIHNFYVNGTSRYQINSSGANLTGRLNIIHSSTSANAENGGFYVYNPNTGSGNCSILGVRINGNSANRCGISLDVNGYYGWNIGINGNDTTNRVLRFNASWDNLGVDRMTLDYNGNLTTSGNINVLGNAGIGTNASSASLSLYSTTQVQARLILSGQEFYVPFNGTLQNSSAEGIAFLCGVNRNGNRQLWIGDSANLTQNSTNSVLRLTNLGYIDCIATDGLTPKPLVIANSLYLAANGVNIGMSTTSYKSSATVLTIARGTNGYSQPLVQITQNNGWDGNYALQVKGYANIGGDGSASGLRINGEDTGNTIFQNGNNPIGFTVNNSWMAFNTNGGERMRIAANGELFFVNNAWQRSYDNVYRMYYETNGRTYFSSGGNLGFTFRSTDQLLDAVRIENNGNIRAARSVYCDGNYGYFLNINANNYWNIYTGTTNGVANSLTFFHGASGLASYWYLNGTQNGTMSEISDKRSKINIQDFSALETIKKLKPKSFDVIDDKDIRFQYGFIAQDIEEIDELKKLVFTQNDYIANVNTYGSCSKLGEENIIKANDDLTGKIEIGDEIKLVCDNNNKENQEFILDSTPYHNRYKRRYGKITEIISPTEFKVDCELFDEPFLIYGKKVEDAKSLDYNSFIALNTKAIQELYDIIQRQQEQINLLLSYRNGN